MTFIALTLLLIQSFACGQEITRYVFAVEGSDANFYFNYTVPVEQFSCFRQEMKLNFTDRYSTKLAGDNSIIFVIKNVTKEDFGPYSCSASGGTQYKQYTLVVVGQINMKVRQLKSVEVTCNVSVTYDPSIGFNTVPSYLALLIDGNETKVAQRGSNEEITSLTYKGDLDQTTVLHNLTCIASCPFISFSESLTKQINTTYQLDVVIVKLNDDAKLFFKRNASQENFVCSKYGGDLITGGRYKTEVPSAGGIYFSISRVTLIDYGEYICRNNMTEEYVVYSLVIVEPVEMSLTQNKTRVNVSCVGSVAKQKGLAFGLYNLSLQICIDSTLVKSLELSLDYVQKTSTLEYSGNLDASTETHNITCAISNGVFSTGITKVSNISSVTTGSTSKSRANKNSGIFSIFFTVLIGMFILHFGTFSKQ